LTSSFAKISVVWSVGFTGVWG